jgi:murein DD-endopeptidase MepM/ murein hydrolase activator NlpD
MLTNYNLLIKFFITILAICFSAYFFYLGHILLNLYKSNSDTPLNLKTNVDLKKNNYISNKNAAESFYELKNDEIVHENEAIIIIKKNDVFSKIINPYFQNNIIKNKIINKLNKEYNLKNLKIGQEIYIYQNSKKIVEKIIIPLDFSTDIVIEINETEIKLSKKEIKLKTFFESNKFFIKSSLYEDGKAAGVPLGILSEAIKLYSFDVDFQRDIQKNDKFEIFYEVFYNSVRGSISNGKIKYIKLNLHGNILEYFIFMDEDGHFDYFNKKGNNARKALMKTPIDGARLSSSYGVRKHPILGYNKLHKGVDFAAPKGTPVFAAGNGVIDFVGKNGGYGKYIRIRHNSSYKTAYAHLNNYNKNIYKGARVNQGDIIGYVGSTGKSTGPHLHYEVIYQNKQINPMKMKLPSGKVLRDDELKKFNKEVKKIYSDFLFYLYE